MNKPIKVGSDFSGVGAFNQALIRLRINYEEIFACDMDRYARKTFIHNYGEPDYYPENVYDREIPTEPLDIYMTSPPCQAFSLAGKRKGEEDKRGVLFYNSHEFIQKNNPRYFIFENVKGLLSSKSTITYHNTIFQLIYNFKQIKEWEKLSYQQNNLNSLSQTISNYLCLNYAKKLGLKKETSGMSYTTNSELDYEKLETKVKSGLKRRLKFLNERIFQITKKQNFLQKELTVPLECKEEDLVLNQDQLYLIESLNTVVTNLLEKTVDINANTSLFANNILEENSKQGKLYTTLMEINSTMTSQTFMYVLEMNIIRLIILALDLSLNLWKEIWLILIGKKEFIGLKTFDIWLFNLDHLNYKVHHQVLNAKDYGVPQNRERIFIIGIRDDADNNFNFPKPFELKKRLKDVLEENVDEKYYLSDKMVDRFVTKKSDKKNNFCISDVTDMDISPTLISGGTSPKDKQPIIKVGFINQDTQASQVFSQESVSQTLCAGTHGYANGYVQVNSATSKGYETARVGEDSINFEHPNPKTRRGRVGVGVGQTLTTSCNQGVAIGAIRGRNIDNPKSRESGLPTQQMLEVNENGTSNCLTTVQKDNVVVEQDYKIRKLTTRECFRLMDFPDTFDFSVVSDSQAYKQAGNSIVIAVLAQIISKFKL